MKEVVCFTFMHLQGLEFDALELAIFQQYYSEVHKRYPPDYGVDNRPLAAVSKHIHVCIHIALTTGHTH